MLLPTHSARTFLPLCLTQYTMQSDIHLHSSYFCPVNDPTLGLYWTDINE